MNKRGRSIAFLFLLFLGVQWVLHDPPDIISLGNPDTDEDVFNDEDVVRAQLSLAYKSSSTTQEEEFPLHAHTFPNGGLVLVGRLLPSIDRNVPQSSATPHRIPRSPPTD